MGKFGKRSTISLNIWDRTIGIMGESGIGKTTTISEVCEKLVGEDGYIILDIGKENGTDCINNVTREKVPTYAVWDEITKDIIENKTTDYPELKIIVVDTYDQLLAITEPYAIALWNKSNIGTKDFKKVNTLNASWGGFGKGMDKVLELILNRIEKLREVGVVTWICSHTRTREITDPLTGNTYTSLSADATQKYFVAIKTKLDILGVACINRDVVKEETNKKNIMTRKAETINKVVSENRVIKFRDDNYAVDSKSRLKHIVSEIPLDADALIKAIQDAIIAENSGNPTINVVEPKPTETKKPTPKVEESEDEDVVEDEVDGVVEDVVDEETTEEVVEDDDDIFEDETPKFDMNVIKAAIKDADKELKTTKIVPLVKANGGKLENCDDDTLAEICKILGI